MRHAAQPRPSGRTGRLPFLRVRALLAGGLVLGVGAAVTAASWSDSEYATATLSTSTFNTESNVGGVGYLDNAGPTGTTVSLPVGAFSPGTTGYLPVLIRTKATSIAGTVVLGGAVFTGTDATLLRDAFVYRVVRTTATCDASAFTSSPVFVVGTSTASAAPLLTVGQNVAVTNTLAAAPLAAPGAPTGFCFEVTLPSNASTTLQGKTASATWQFLATSN
jgi:predicted ribosomally synthesized peptide with SipW-like signal peptide